MKRREFIAGLGGAAAAWPFAAHAQQAAKVPTIGFLGQLTPSAMSKWTAAFVRRLRELGWVEDRTVAIEYRWAEGRSRRNVPDGKHFCADGSVKSSVHVDDKRQFCWNGALG